MEKTTEELKRILDAKGFWCNEYLDEFEFGKCTPLGEDWFECIQGLNAKDFVENLESRVNGFDIDDEVEVWIPLRGKRGVPEKITDLIEDAKWKKAELEELLKELKEV